MNTEDHLRKILAKCRENLKLADKRTPGKWYNAGGWTVLSELDSGTMICNMPNGMENRIETVSFIAACAGSAEAGWKSTMTMCEWLIDEIAEYGEQDRLVALANSIIESWKDLFDTESNPL